MLFPNSQLRVILLLYTLKALLLEKGSRYNPTSNVEGLLDKEATSYDDIFDVSGLP